MPRPRTPPSGATARNSSDAPRSGHGERLLGELDAAAARHEVAPSGLAAECCVVGTAHDGAVAGEPVGDPHDAVVLAELEVRLRDGQVRSAICTRWSKASPGCGSGFRPISPVPNTVRVSPVLNASTKRGAAVTAGRGRGRPRRHIRRTQLPSSQPRGSPSPSGSRAPECSTTPLLRLRAVRWRSCRPGLGIRSAARLGRRARGAAAVAAEHRSLGERCSADPTRHGLAPLRVTAYRRAR